MKPALSQTMGLSFQKRNVTCSDAEEAVKLVRLTVSGPQTGVEEWIVCLGKRMILGGPLADRRTRQGRHRPNLIFFSLEIPFIK